MKKPRYAIVFDNTSFSSSNKFFNPQRKHVNKRSEMLQKETLFTVSKEEDAITIIDSLNAYLSGLLLNLPSYESRVNVPINSELIPFPCFYGNYIFITFEELYQTYEQYCSLLAQDFTKDDLTLDDIINSNIMICCFYYEELQSF